MTETTWKHDLFWGAIVLTFLSTLCLAGFICSIHERERPPIVTYRLEIIHPSPPPIPGIGKRNEPGVLSPETLKAVELQTAKELFSGESRDPFEARWK